MRFLALIIILIAVACEPEEEKFTTNPSARLRFSADTLFFDTVFTSIGSITKRFKVYNDNPNAVNISKVTLQGGVNSPFNIYVNGLAGPVVNDIRVLGGDSILVLSQVNIDPQDQNLRYIVEDKLSFDINGNQQDVELVAWGQDANFLRDSVLTCNSQWTADRPYVIYNSILVAEGCLLTIDPGTKIYSHNGSFILIGGQLNAAGTTDEPILFTNDRFDEEFINAPGQWGGIVFLENSQNNVIDNAKIRNANIGIYLGTPDDNADPDLTLSNTIIENIGGNDIIPSIESLVQPGYGILAVSSDLDATNVLINNCEINVLANVAGGNYNYTHCTFANYSFDYFRTEPSMTFANNLILNPETLLVGDLNVNMQNCILWGALQEEMVLSNNPNAGWSLFVENNILRTELSEFTAANLVVDPNFVNPQEYDYQLKELSPAIDAGINLGIMFDIDGNARDIKPDIGAYEFIIN